VAAAADQRHLPQGRMTGKRVKKLSQALDLLANMVHAILHKDLQFSKKLTRWVTELLYKAMNKERVGGVCSNNYCGSFTIMGNALIVGKLAGDKTASWPASPLTRRPPRRKLEGVVRNRMAADFAKALQR
jgi:hypothetical protein